MAVSTTISIDAPPHVVRQVLLDFPNLNKWHSSHFQSITVVQPGKTGMQVAPGDTLKVGMGSMTFTPTMQENTAGEFRWLGSLPYIFSGAHRFIFSPHPSGDPNKTQFSQHEAFTGLLSPLFSFSEGKTKLGFEKLDRDLKAEAEKRWRASQEV